MGKPPVAYAEVIKVNGDSMQPADDLVAAEEPLEIRLGYGAQQDRQQKKISVTMRTPGNDFELALGFLFTEGIVVTNEEVHSIAYCTELNTLVNQENIVRVELAAGLMPDMEKLQRNFYTTSSCGVCGKASIDAVRTVCETPPATGDALRVNRQLILSLPAALRASQNVFEHTGGLHASALFDGEGKLLMLREDVGRHNALDKVIGAALKAGMLPLEKNILLLSGRASFELIQKAAMAGIRIVCAVGAPSSLAVEMAKEFDMTLIGFLRDQRFNIYCGGQRIPVQDKK